MAETTKAETREGARRNSGKRRLLWIGGSVLLVLLLLFLSFGLYVSDFYKALPEAKTAFAGVGIPEKELSDGSVLFGTGGEETGFLFYPGGKVEHTAYAPLMRSIASEGIACVLVKMPFRLAVLRSGAAEELKKEFPDVKRWFLGGHSLGGAMAAHHLSSHAPEYEGLVLLGAYSADDLSGTHLSVLLIRGSEDGVLNREKYEKCRNNLPERTEEITLSGGCHAYFGMYGAQKGDGKPGIANEEQIRLTAQAIAAFFGKG